VVRSSLASWATGDAEREEADTDDDFVVPELSDG
jgi:hypothetical protein